MVRRVVSFADNGVQMRLTRSLVGANALLEDALGLFDKLAVQIDAVRLDTTGCVVLAEDVLGRLSVVVIHLGSVRLALVGELLGGGAIAGLVGIARLSEMDMCQWRKVRQLGRRGGTTYALEAVVALLGLGACLIAETVILTLDFIVVARVESFAVRHVNIECETNCALLRTSAAQFLHLIRHNGRQLALETTKIPKGRTGVPARNGFLVVICTCKRWLLS